MFFLENLFNKSKQRNGEKIEPRATIFYISEKNRVNQSSEVRQLHTGEEIFLNEGLIFRTVSEEMALIIESGENGISSIVSFDPLTYGIRPFGDVSFPCMEPPLITNGEISIWMDSEATQNKRIKANKAGILTHVFDEQGLIIPEVNRSHQKPQFSLERYKELLNAYS